MSKYKISIIIPVYNVEEYIEKSFDSLLNQTFGFSNLEILFVDDCSSDKSPQIIDEYASSYENVFAYHLEENSGFAGKPRNLGIDNASGEYILFLDSDDYLEEDACERLYSSICDLPDVDFVTGGYTNVYPDGKVLTQVPMGFRGIYPNGKMVNQVPKGIAETRIVKDPINDYELYSLNTLLASKLVRRDFLSENKIYFEEGIPAQDTIFIYHLILNSKSALLLNDYSSFNRIIRSDVENKSVSFDVSSKYLFNLLAASNKIADVCEEYKVHDDFTYIALSRIFGYFLIKFDESGLEDSEKEEIIKSEIFQAFKNRRFFTKRVEFRIAFDNILTVDPKYLVFLRDNKMNELKQEKKFKNLQGENKKLKSKNKKLVKKEKEMKDSNTWKLGSPLRKIGKKLK